MKTLPAFPNDVLDHPDCLRQYIGWRCFLYDSLHNAGCQGHRLAPCDVAPMLTRSMKAFLRQVQDSPDALHRSPHSRRSGMINDLRDAGLLDWSTEFTTRPGRRYERRDLRRRYHLTDRGRSVLCCVETP